MLKGKVVELMNRAEQIKEFQRKKQEQEEKGSGGGVGEKRRTKV